MNYWERIKDNGIIAVIQQLNELQLESKKIKSLDGFEPMTSSPPLVAD